MISAFARASVVFDNKEYLDVAKSSADFIIKNTFNIPHGNNKYVWENK